TISKSLLETNDFVIDISAIVASIALFLLIALFFLNRWISKKIWAPFNNTLNELQNFDINTFKELYFGKTDIFEFNELNNAVKKMTAKIFSDYLNLKEFTENASHEIQTPLAIISAKLEMLIQSGSLSREQSDQIQGAYEATIRLSKLNQGLILLTRIENRQYPINEKVFFKKNIEDRLVILKDFIEKRTLSITFNAEKEVVLMMNPELASILINNLIGNAIKHNIDGGEIIIELSEKKLSVCNSGDVMTIDTERIFERFQKSKNSDSMGLGLAIAKKIAELYQYKISYSYINAMHCITVDFIA
ncbi:MAG TPA: HAMP domain-containing sensor histidine kinase, partial [Bacteroidia bacterium]|nr:HAMP domain-containing sensor histidine kinase [Bacteroidia bacterium]